MKKNKKSIRASGLLPKLKQDDDDESESESESQDTQNGASKSS